MRVVLKVLAKKGPLGIHFLKRDLNQTGNLHYGHFGDRYREQPPHGNWGCTTALQETYRGMEKTMETAL